MRRQHLAPGTGTAMPVRSIRRRLGLLPVAAAAAIALAGCDSSSPQLGPPPGSGVQPVGTPAVLATGLEAPWSIVPLDDGSTLLSARDTGVVSELTAEGDLREVGVVDGVVHDGESGLLGLAVSPDAGSSATASSATAPSATAPSATASPDSSYLYAYLTTATDNRIVRYRLQGEAGSYSLGERTDILTGLVAASRHDGGRIRFGPDGMLYATVGDAGDTALSQDLDSLNGKILRMNPDGTAPDDNPYPGSLVYSSGHRNPQGIAWDDDGQLFAAEFGQDTWDEFNRIEAGGNYGWPEVEGEADDDRYISPLLSWPTDDASPSGLEYVRGTFFMAGLGGERLWVIYPREDIDTGYDPVAWFEGEYGRIRDVTAGPNGSLLMLTNNTDGRGSQGPDDDLLLQVELGELVEG